MSGPHVAILTAIYDDYDTLKPTLPQKDVGTVEWICVTDSRELAAQAVEEFNLAPGPRMGLTRLVHPTGWEIVYRPRPGEHPNRAAKHPKMLPWDYTAARTTVWLDASFRVTSPDLAADMATTVGVLTPHGPTLVAQFGHPWRQCLYEEEMASAGLPKYADQRQLMLDQVARYHEAGMPRDWGLWATGFIARHRSPGAEEWGAAWLAECRNWSFQDQISHPFVCWQHGIRPVTLPGTHFSNPWVAYEGSGRH